MFFHHSIQFRLILSFIKSEIEFRLISLNVSFFLASLNLSQSTHIQNVLIDQISNGFFDQTCVCRA